MYTYLILNKVYILIPKCDDCNIIDVTFYIILMLEFSNTVHAFYIPSTSSSRMCKTMTTHWNF